MSFGIRLDTHSGEGFVGGSSIRGSVFFNVKKEVVAKGDVVASLQGGENTRVKYTRQVKQGDHYVTRTYHAYGSRNLVQIAIPISASSMIQNGKINAGNYVLPFDVQLPQGLPSSMQHSESGSDCSISYTLKAQIKGSGWFQDYKCEKAIRVTGTPLSSEPMPYNGEPVESQVNNCCFNRGHMLFGARVSDTSLNQGEDVRINMSCRNRTTVPVESVNAVIMQKIWFSASSHSKSSSNTLARRNFGKFPGLERIDSLSLNKERSIGGDLREVAKDLQEAKYSATLQMPHGAYPTYPGSLIRVEHCILVTVNTGACISNPTVFIPIQVGTAKSTTTQQQVVPLEEPEISFDFNSAYSAEPVHVLSPDAHLGGAPQDLGEKEEEQEPEINIEAEITVAQQRTASIENLLKEMKESIQDVPLVQQKLDSAEWNQVFSSLSATDYGRIIKHVDLDFDQSKVAVAVAQSVPYFTCNYVVGAIANCSEWSRATMVEKLLPYTKDLAANKEKILSRLSEWDRQVTERAFKSALEGKHH